jgi:hypothetical protein
MAPAVEGAVLGYDQTVLADQAWDEAFQGQAPEARLRVAEVEAAGHHVPDRAGFMERQVLVVKDQTEFLGFSNGISAGCSSLSR